jgi:REP element-mobilizing transposase RayT
MAEKFQNKYRIPSARASWWNYGAEGMYFITINTYNKNYWFGEIVEGEMVLSEIGKIVLEEWDKSFGIRVELFCDVFVIMPNHLHAILRIENSNQISQANVETHGRVSKTSSYNDSVHNETHGSASLQTGTMNNEKLMPIRIPKSISSFIAGFKSAATKRINQYRNTPKHAVWQARFYDHIIRSTEEYIRISNYICTNVERWEEDVFYQNGMRI